MIPRAAALAAALLVGCGSLPTVGGGVAILEVTPPAVTKVDIDGHLQFTARALDKQGHPVDAEITWATADTTITIDAVTGLVTGVKAGTGRVQASVGEGDARLYSDFFLVTVNAAKPPAPPQ